MKPLANIGSDLTTPLALAGAVFVFTFSAIDLLLTGGISQDLDPSAVAALFLALPMLAAVAVTICTWLVAATLRTVFTVFRIGNSGFSIRIISAAVGMLPAWYIVATVMGLENGFGFTYAHIWVALVLAMGSGAIAFLAYERIYSHGSPTETGTNAG